MITLNSTTPPAPTGGSLVKWQQDASGNVSAYTGAAAAPPTTFAPVAGVLTIDASAGSVAYVNVNAAITSSSVTNPTDGQVLTVFWKQDSTGHTIVLPTNFIGATAPSTTGNSNSIQQFLYNAANNNWYGLALGQTGL
jgi:hypothetical protein